MPIVLEDTVCAECLVGKHYCFLIAILFSIKCPQGVLGSLLKLKKIIFYCAQHSVTIFQRFIEKPLLGIGNNNKQYIFYSNV